MGLITKRAETPAEIEKRQIEEQIAAEYALAKLDPWVIQFLAMTPAQAQTYVMNNTPTLADMRTVVGRIAFVVNVLAKRELKR